MLGENRNQIPSNSGLQKNQERGGNKTQYVATALAIAKPDDLKLTPRTYMVEGDSSKLFSDLYLCIFVSVCACMCPRACTHAHTPV